MSFLGIDNNAEWKYNPQEKMIITTRRCQQPRYSMPTQRQNKYTILCIPFNDIADKSIIILWYIFHLELREHNPLKSGGCNER